MNYVRIKWSKGECLIHMPEAYLKRLALQVINDHPVDAKPRNNRSHLIYKRNNK
jgi:hypothetical protein